MPYGRLLRQRRRHRRLLLGVLAIVVLAIAAERVNRLRKPDCTQVDGRRVVNLPLAELGLGTAKAFCYRDADDAVIRFIVGRDADGIVYSAFDACRGCFEHHQGYRLAGGQMVCRFCSRAYRVKDMGTGIASCVPLRLPHQTSSDAVQIRVADLEAGRELFSNRDESTDANQSMK